MATCKVELGATVFLGNYETMRVMVGCEDTTKDDSPAERDACYERLRAEARTRMEDIILSEGENLMRFLPVAKEELRNRVR